MFLGAFKRNFNVQTKCLKNNYLHITSKYKITSYN